MWTAWPVSLWASRAASRTGHTVLSGGLSTGGLRKNTVSPEFWTKTNQLPILGPFKCISPVGLAQAGPNTPLSLTPREDSNTHGRPACHRTALRAKTGKQRTRCLLRQGPLVLHYPPSPTCTRRNFKLKKATAAISTTVPSTQGLFRNNNTFLRWETRLLRALNSERLSPFPLTADRLSHLSNISSFWTLIS